VAPAGIEPRTFACETNSPKMVSRRRPRQVFRRSYRRYSQMQATVVRHEQFAAAAAARQAALEAELSDARAEVGCLSSDKSRPGKRIYLPVSSVGASITSRTCTSSAVTGDNPQFGVQTNHVRKTDLFASVERCSLDHEPLFVCSLCVAMFDHSYCIH